MKYFTLKLKCHFKGMKNEKPFYSVSYSEIHTTRTTNVKNFDLLREAKGFLETVNGYLIRHVPEKTKVLSYNNFKPSATEGRRIEGILQVWNKI